MEVSDRKDFSPSSTEPSVRIGSMTFGTASVSTGMIGITQMSAVAALGQVAPKGLCAALSYILKCMSVTGKDHVAEALQILDPVTPEDVRQFGHCPEVTADRLPDRSVRRSVY